MNIENIHRVYLIGIGGIGMSALARYFLYLGKDVAGYDSTQTQLTAKLEEEEINICYVDKVGNIPEDFLENPLTTLVVYTPAIPKSHKQFNFFKAKEFKVVKRAEALGAISKSFTTLAVAGTHGKTTTSTMAAHLLCQTEQGCDAFLGGIAKNFSSNLVLRDNGSNRLVVEADEFDRSFLHIEPSLAIITSIDADHLDIYGTHDEVKAAFKLFVKNIKDGGVLIVKKGLENIANERSDIKTYMYSVEEGSDFHASNLSPQNGFYTFDFVTPFGTYTDFKLGVLGKYNVENAIAAAAAALIWGISIESLKNGLATFSGVERRFEVKHQDEKCIYIDDYAHHPEELRAAISSAREIFPSQKISGIFQPHLYSRTRDFASEFAQSLNLLDELILLDIYPAREEPIPGVSSQIIFNQVNIQEKVLCSYNELLGLVENKKFDVLISMGAGNIDKLTSKIASILKTRES